MLPVAEEVGIAQDRKQRDLLFNSGLILEHQELLGQAVIEASAEEPIRCWQVNRENRYPPEENAGDYRVYAT